MRKRRLVGVGVALGLSAICTLAQAAENRPCLPTEAVADAAVAEFQAQTVLNAANGSALKEMMAISDKAKSPSVPIKDQLPAADIIAFNNARALVVKLKMFSSSISRNTRNMQIVAAIEEYDDVVDTYHFDMSSVGKNDPRAFYFSIIEALREAQPNPLETNLPDPKGGCTMEAALSLVEHFNMQEMASYPTDKGALDLILDIRRLEQLLSICEKPMSLIN